MKSFFDEALRTKQLVSFLKGMGLSLDQVELSCNDSFIIIKSQQLDHLNRLGESLQSLLQSSEIQPAINHCSMVDLVRETIKQNVKDKKQKETCDAILSIHEQSGCSSFDGQRECFNVTLPKYVLAVFASLEWHALTVEKSTINVAVDVCLRAQPNAIVLIEKPEPLMLIHTSLLESKKVFYAEKQQGENVEITPYLFVPRTSYPPVFHFVLDTSRSMQNENRLPLLKQSVICFAKEIFAVQPQTTISITQFNGSINPAVTYGKDSLNKLEQDVESIKINAGTQLYGATLGQLQSLQNSDCHNNVLLFTDGENTVGKDGLLQQKIDELREGSDLVRARNRFYIISCMAKQPQIMHDVAALFGSPVISSDDGNFQKALSQEGELAQWVVSRELFTIRLEVDGRDETYVLPCNISGDVIPLKPGTYNQQETFHLTITDSKGKLILDDTRAPKQLIKPLIQPDTAPALETAGTTVKEETQPVTIKQGLSHTLWSHAGKIAGATAVVVTAAAYLMANN